MDLLLLTKSFLLFHARLGILWSLWHFSSLWPQKPGTTRWTSCLEWLVLLWTSIISSFTTSSPVTSCSSTFCYRASTCRIFASYSSRIESSNTLSGHTTFRSAAWLSCDLFTFHCCRWMRLRCHTVSQRSHELANQGTRSPFVEPVPVYQLVKQETKEMLTKHHHWKIAREQKQYFEQACRETTKILLKLSRGKIRLFTELITGHCQLNKYLHNYSLEPDLTSRRYNEEEESPL